MSRVWTQKDDARLMELVNKGWSTKRISKDLDRSEDAIRSRCNKLGCYLKGRGKKWRPQEIEEFKKDWVDEEMCSSALVRKYYRTMHGLTVMAVKLGLGERPQDSRYVSVQVVCEEMQVSSDRVYRWVKMGLKTHRSNNKRTKYLIDVNKLLTFLEEHNIPFNASKVSDLLFIDEPDWLKQKRKDDFGKNESKSQMEWTNDEDARLIRLYKYGKSVKELAKEFKRTEGAIITHLNILGVERKKESSFTDKELDLLRRYSEYKTLQEIVEIMGRHTVKSLEYKCKELGVPYHLSKKMVKKEET